MTAKQKLNQNQRGLASILVTMILMVIISLIVIGLARLSRREQRQVLDDQLSTQAFYAAESGVNDAIKELQSGTVDLSQNYTSDCRNFINGQHLQTKSQLSGTDVQYTCLLIKPNPDDLKFDRVTTNNSTVAQLNADQSSMPDALIENLKISWQDADGGNDVSGCPTPTTSLLPRPGWPGTCQTGILRVDIATKLGGGAFDRNSLAEGTLTYFLYPQPAGSGVTTFDTSVVYPNLPTVKNGSIIPVKCDGSGPRQCTVEIQNLPQFVNGAIRMKSIYKDSAVTLSATYSGNQVQFTGGQTEIDATGKANDVLRRIQVRVNPSQTSLYPEFAIQSGDTICKRLLIAQPGGQADTNENGVEACRILDP